MPTFVPAVLDQGRTGGRPAAFWTRAILAPALASGEVTRTFVLWEHDDLLTRVDAAGLSREEVARVLESLAEQP